MTRISATKGDAGYGQYLVCQENDRWPKIILDGSEVKDVLTADDECGLIIKFVMDETGRPVIELGRDEIATEVLHGTVAFVWPAPSEEGCSKSVGVGKGWRRWRNQATRGGKDFKLVQELKDRFGHKSKGKLDEVSQNGPQTSQQREARDRLHGEKTESAAEDHPSRTRHRRP
jgi:hypothetical protein